MFLRSSNMTALVRILSYMPGWMIYRRWRPETGTGYIPQIYHNPWRGRVFGWVQLRCLTLKSWVYPLEFRFYHEYKVRYKLFRNHFHLQTAIWFLTHPDIRPYLDQSSRVVDIKNIDMSVGVVLISRIQAEIYVIPYSLSVKCRHLWFPTHPEKWQCLNQSGCVAWRRKHRYSRWNCVANMCTSWCTLFHIYFRFLAAFFDFSLTLTSSCTSVRPTMLFDPKGMRILLTFHLFSIFLLH